MFINLTVEFAQFSNRKQTIDNNSTIKNNIETFNLHIDNISFDRFYNYLQTRN